MELTFKNETFTDDETKLDIIVADKIVGKKTLITKQEILLLTIADELRKLNKREIK